MIIDGQTGILVQPQSVESLKDGILRIMQSNRLELGITGQQHVTVMFSHRHILAEYALLFDELLENKIVPKCIGSQNNQGRLS